jgi:hypothetical protein
MLPDLQNGTSMLEVSQAFLIWTPSLADEDDYGALIGWNWEGKTEILWEKSAAVPTKIIWIIHKN